MTILHLNMQDLINKKEFLAIGENVYSLKNLLITPLNSNGETNFDLVLQLKLTDEEDIKTTEITITNNSDHDINVENSPHIKSIAGGVTLTLPHELIITCDKCQEEIKNGK